MTPHLLPAPAPGELTGPERLSRDELQARQLDRLRHTLRHAYERVPFYRQAFDRAGRVKCLSLHAPKSRSGPSRGPSPGRTVSRAAGP